MADSYAEFIYKLRQQQQNEVTIECNVRTFVAPRIDSHGLSAASYLWHIGVSC